MAPILHEKQIVHTEIMTKYHNRMIRPDTIDGYTTMLGFLVK
jgi:hypothetical protein